jgi:glycerol kinase
VTEPSNASRTLLYNLEGHWDPVLLKRFGIPEAILPKVVPSVGRFGIADAKHFGVAIPVMGVAGDQQAALFGQACYESGQVKSTYGTGCFLMMNTGEKLVRSSHRLLTTVAWQIGKQIEYALEGSVFSAGSAVQWLRDGIHLITSASETEDLAMSVGSSEGVVFVPAFTGLGAPYWDPEARGALLGVTRGTRREHIARAVLEAVAFENRDLLEAMDADLGRKPDVLRVDGGMVANNFLMQFQADLLGIPVDRARNPESTGYGAACLASLGAGWFSSPAEIAAKRQSDRIFQPVHSEATEALYRGWKVAVARVLTR